MTEKEKFVLENYIITPNGKVLSNLNSNNNYQYKELKLRSDKDGYLDVTLLYNEKGDRQPFRIHRLVALKYLQNLNNYNIVNHIDCDKTNNNVNNLEWSTVSMNTQHGYDNSRYKYVKKVKATLKDGTVHIFPSISHAARFFNYANPSTIQAILEGRRENPISKGIRKGLYFEYTNESVTTIERVADTVVSE